MNKRWNIVVLLVVQALFGCQREAEMIDGPQHRPGSDAEPETKPTFNDEVTGSSNDLSKQTMIPDLVNCFDREGQVIVSQFIDKANNDSVATFDCYDQRGSLVYQAEMSGQSCLEAMETRFGAERIFYPAMQLFPRLYAEAQDKGAGGVDHLKRELAAAPCHALQ